MKKYYKRVHAKDNQLLLRYGKADSYSGDDLVVAHGKECSSTDSSLLMQLITSDTLVYNSTKTEPSFLQELEKRGYDIKTLKISIEKK